MDRRTRKLYIMIRNKTPVEVRTSPAVILQFGFPATSVDDFFGENLVQNLAA